MRATDRQTAMLERDRQCAFVFVYIVCIGVFVYLCVLMLASLVQDVTRD